MIIEHLLSFTVVVLSQLLFFLFHAWRVGELSNVPKYLLQGCLLGLPFGIAFDMLVGKTIGIFTYELGYPLWFLTINGFFSYGFMIANVLLLFRHSVLHMYAWSASLSVFYEVTNYFFPVWQWEFMAAPYSYLVVIFAAYAGLTWLMMAALRIVFGYHFRLVPF